ncbi:MAG TPA: hypothetical protein VH063_15185 [Gaiellaceae bacterium]|nr:hypothetical protein [Gaiellaceae bacterium]
MSNQDDLPAYERRLLDELLAYRERLLHPPAVQTHTGSLLSARKMLFAVAVGVSIALGAAGIVILAGGSHTRVAIAPRTASQIKQRMLLAVSSSDDEILYAHEEKNSIENPGGASPTIVPSGQTDTWEDLSTGRSRLVSYDAQGQIQTESASSTTGNVWRADFVLYFAHSWQTMLHTFSNGAPTPAGSEGLADIFRNQDAKGAFTLVGTGMIGGESVLHLRRPWTIPFPGGASALAPTSIDVWVDATTYLPVRQEIHAGPAVINRTVYSWLPRTAANLEKLNLVIPPGFTHTTGSDNSSAGGSSMHASSGTTILTPTH